jgi:RHS repeat-associated protein
MIYFYGANGDRLATYNYFGNGIFQIVKTDLYFAGRLLAVMDRLGSVRGNKYLPFGEEQPASANDTDKFATYFRDSSTGLDYALNRYYSSTMARFLTPDPFRSTTRMHDPQGWNPYAYVHNDPVNYFDPLGLDRCPANDPNCIEVNDTYDRIGTIVGPLAKLHETTVQAQIDMMDKRDSANSDEERTPCNPEFFDSEPIVQSPTDKNHPGTDNYFTGTDLNYAARVVYAEAAGSSRGGSAAERDAMASVLFNRVGRAGFTGGVQWTFGGVANAFNQFESVTGGFAHTRKFAASARWWDLSPWECDELRESVNAIRRLMSNGPQYDFTFNRGGTSGPGTVIGGSRFW